MNWTVNVKDYLNSTYLSEKLRYELYINWCKAEKRESNFQELDFLENEANALDIGKKLYNYYRNQKASYSTKWTTLERFFQTKTESPPPKTIIIDSLNRICRFLPKYADTTNSWEKFVESEITTCKNNYIKGLMSISVISDNNPLYCSFLREKHLHLYVMIREGLLYDFKETKKIDIKSFQQIQQIPATQNTEPESKDDISSDIVSIIRNDNLLNYLRKSIGKVKQGEDIKILGFWINPRLFDEEAFEKGYKNASSVKLLLCNPLGALSSIRGKDVTLVKKSIKNDIFRLKNILKNIEENKPKLEVRFFSILPPFYATGNSTDFYMGFFYSELELNEKRYLAYLKLKEKSEIYNTAVKHYDELWNHSTTFNFNLEEDSFKKLPQIIDTHFKNLIAKDKQYKECKELFLFSPLQ